MLTSDYCNTNLVRLNAYACNTLCITHTPPGTETPCHLPHICWLFSTVAVVPVGVLAMLIGSTRLVDVWRNRRNHGARAFAVNVCDIGPARLTACDIFPRESPMKILIAVRY